MQTIAVANQKGGVGKTTVAVHLAVGMARKKKRVLLVDLDPQGSATKWLLGKLPADAKGAAEMVLDGKAWAVEAAENLMVSPSTPSLGSLDLALAQEIGKDTALARALASVRGFDTVILDCPPNLGLTVLNAICASDAVLAPVSGAYLSLVGLGQLEGMIQRAKELLKVRTRVLGYLLFAADERESITAQSRDVLRKRGNLFKAEVRVSTAAKILPAQRRTAWDAGADARGAEDYSAVLKETVSRLERRAA